MSFTQVDALFGTDNVNQCYQELKNIYEGGQKDAEVLWRLARSCHEVACRTTNKDEKKKLFFEGQKYGSEAVSGSDSNFMALKWAAIMTGQTTELLGTKEKIAQGAVFKDYLDRALSVDGKDFILLHLRGRFSFSVAGLTWLERKAATLLYSTPPSATYDEALVDFLAACDQHPEWIENLLYLARCYLEKKDKSSAVKYLKMAEKLKPADDNDKELLQECAKLLSKC